MIDDAARALVHFEVEPNYAGWTLAAYVAEKLKRPLAPARLDRLLRGRALVHGERELLPETRIWPGLRFSLSKRSPGDDGEPPAIPVIYEDDALLVVDKPAWLARRAAWWRAAAGPCTRARSRRPSRRGRWRRPTWRCARASPARTSSRSTCRSRWAASASR